MKTTIDQHKGNHPNGMRITALLEICTERSNYISDQEYEALEPKVRAEIDATVGEIHAATVELESLDADVRQAARELLAYEGNMDMDNEASVIRACIEAAKNGN